MKTSQSFPFYPGDFIFGTMLMTPAQVGGYIRALCYEWESGGLPAGLASLSQITGLLENDLEIVLKKFVERDGVFVNLRLERVREERNAYLAVQREKGKKGGRPRSSDKTHGLSDDKTRGLGGKLNPRVRGKLNPNERSPFPSPSPSTEAVLLLKKSSKSQTDDEWLASLRDNPAFSSIDIDAELRGAQVWAEAHGRQCSRRFFENWLNRDKPIAVAPPAPAAPPEPKPVPEPDPYEFLRNPHWEPRDDRWHYCVDALPEDLRLKFKARKDMATLEWCRLTSHERRCFARVAGYTESDIKPWNEPIIQTNASA